jgi:CRISPR-associated endonuclease/helicase Cas3
LFKDSTCREWDQKDQKQSHEGKLLATHIAEVKKMLTQFLGFYHDFPEISYEMADYLAEYHDYGKLCRDWRLNGDRKSLPPHSPLSLQWLLEKPRIFDSPRKWVLESKEWTFFLWFLILKHHSRLTDTIGVARYKRLIDELQSRLDRIDTKSKIDLIDLFGLFKIADVFSANNTFYELQEPKITEATVRSIITSDLKEGDWKEGIWKQQLELQKLHNVGILRAPTGWGKTTASLLFFVNKPVRKIFFLLPTITAISKFHNKLSRGLLNKVTKYFYFYDAELSEEDDKLNELFFSQNFIYPYSITTIDQFLLSFLQYGRYHTKRVMFRGAGLVFDEVHLLNPLMLSLTKYFLEKYAPLYKLNVLFMSATLPDALSQFLINTLNVPSQSFLDYADEYHKRRRIMLSYNNGFLETDINLMVEHFRQGKKVLVIVNTVDRAIEIARLLRESVSPDSVVLIHSRLIYRDRKRKEREIDKKSASPHILVSTQICEVSLDISYDSLFTELSPLPSLVQRFGRVNRYGGWINELNTNLYEPRVENEFSYPYEANEVNLARKIIKEVEGDKLKSEGQLLDLFNQLYSYDFLEKEIDRAMRKIDLEAFEEILGFFSLDAKEEKLMNVLNYRDSFSFLVVPDPSCIRSKTLSGYVEGLLSQPLGEMDFENRRKIIARIKNVSLPVPIWLIGERSESKPFPVASFKNRSYDEYYGLIGDDIS